MAVTEKSEACEALLADISTKTTEANEKKSLAEAKGVEIEQQNVVIAKEKVSRQTDALEPHVHSDAVGIQLAGNVIPSLDLHVSACVLMCFVYSCL